MMLVDHWQFSWHALTRHRLRSFMLLVAVSIGVASVLLLTSIGEGARLFIQQEFSALGSSIMVVLPGRKETTGKAPPIYGTSARDLTIEDAQALKSISSIAAVAPIIAGMAAVRNNPLSREVIILGTTAAIFTVRNLRLSAGRMLPNNSDDSASQVCILGAELANELFSSKNPLGQQVRIGEYRYRVIGVLEKRGESLGLDLRQMAIIPIRSAEILFNSAGLFRIVLQLSQAGSENYTKRAIEQRIARRHEGESDITIVSQDSVLNAFNKILVAVTAGIGGIAAISLFVAGILIMNVSYISVSQRRQEIGLLKSLGASKGEILRIFLLESLLLVSVGTLTGIILSYALVGIVHLVFTDVPVAIPWWSTVSASFTALVLGVLFSWLPAMKAAAVDPIRALKE